MTSNLTLEELAERAAEVAAAALRTPPLDMVRAMLNEAGVPRARGVLRDGLDRLADKQAALRVAQEAERDAKAALTEEVNRVEWELDHPHGGCFERRANKVWLVRYADGSAIPENEQRILLADEKREWLTAAARQDPNVLAAEQRLRAANHEVAVCRDALDVAEVSLRCARADLEAAVATLTALSLALPTRNGDT